MLLVVYLIKTGKALSQRVESMVFTDGVTQIMSLAFSKEYVNPKLCQDTFIYLFIFGCTV